MAGGVSIPLKVRAQAFVKIAEAETAAARAAETLGPFVYLDELDPLPVPPADDAVFETEVAVQPVAVGGEELRRLMGLFKARQL